jgi:hypothetical protein
MIFMFSCETSRDGIFQDLCIVQAYYAKFVEVSYFIVAGKPFGEIQVVTITRSIA